MKIDIKGNIVSNEEARIYAWFDIPCCSPKAVAEILEKSNGENIDVYINSDGGDLFAGIEIYSELRAYKGEVNIHIVGLAGSAASVIAMAGKSDITPAGLIMIHNVQTLVQGDYRDMQHGSEILQQANKAICEAYIAKTGRTEAELLKLMDNETWFTSKDAIEFGFVDSVAVNQNLKLTACTNYFNISKIKALAKEIAQLKLNLLKLSEVKL